MSCFVWHLLLETSRNVHDSWHNHGDAYVSVILSQIAVILLLIQKQAWGLKNMSILVIGLLPGKSSSLQQWKEVRHSSNGNQSISIKISVPETPSILHGFNHQLWISWTTRFMSACNLSVIVRYDSSLIQQFLHDPPCEKAFLKIMKTDKGQLLLHVSGWIDSCCITRTGNSLALRPGLVQRNQRQTEVYNLKHRFRARLETLPIALLREKQLELEEQKQKSQDGETIVKIVRGQAWTMGGR